MTTNSEPPLVSVVVPFFNLAHNAEPCIRSLLAQEAPDFSHELLVVDNMSSDGTFARLKNFAPGVRVLREETPGAAAARNRGIRAAKGEFVAMMDGDCLADPHWLSAFASRARSVSDNTIMGGPILPKDVDTLVSVFSRHLFDQRAAMTSKELPYAASGNMFLARSLLLQLGLFDETLARGHDVDFSWRALKQCSGEFRFVPEARVFHSNPRTVGELFREGLKHGRGVALITTRHGDVTGFTPLRRILEVGRYRRIFSDLLDYIKGPRGRGQRAALQRMFHLYWVIFNSGKQLACVLHSTKLLLTHRKRQARYAGKAQ